MTSITPILSTRTFQENAAISSSSSSSSSSNSSVVTQITPISRAIPLTVDVSGIISDEEKGRLCSGSKTIVPSVLTRNPNESEKFWSTLSLPIRDLDQGDVKRKTFYLLSQPRSYVQVILGQNFQICHYPFSKSDFSPLKEVNINLFLTNRFKASKKNSRIDSGLRTYSSACISHFEMPHKFRRRIFSEESERVVSISKIYHQTQSTSRYCLTALSNIFTTHYKNCALSKAFQEGAGSSPQLRLKKINLKWPDFTFPLNLEISNRAIFTICGKNKTSSLVPTQRILFSVDGNSLPDDQVTTLNIRQSPEEVFFEIIWDSKFNKTFSLPSLLEKQPPKQYTRKIEAITELNVNFNPTVSNHDEYKCSYEIGIKFDELVASSSKSKPFIASIPYTKKRTKITSTKQSGYSKRLRISSIEETYRLALEYILDYENYFGEKKQNAVVSSVGSDSASAADAVNPKRRKRVESAGARKATDGATKAAELHEEIRAISKPSNLSPVGTDLANAADAVNSKRRKRVKSAGATKATKPPQEICAISKPSDSPDSTSTEASSITPTVQFAIAGGKSPDKESFSQDSRSSEVSGMSPLARADTAGDESLDIETFSVENFFEWIEGGEWYK